MAERPRKDDARAATQTAAQTAAGPMVVVALDQYEPPARRIVDDPLALALLPGSSQKIVCACRFRPLRAALRWFSETATPGVWAGILARKRYIDDVVRAALDDGFASVVTLGAGLDSRSCRLVAPAGRAAVELDLPVNVAMKRAAILRALGAVPPGVALVALDFEHDDLGAALAGQGLDLARPSLVVWEGVTQYLDAAAVRATLAALGRLAPGSRLVFTYVLDDLVSGRDKHGADKLYRRFVEGHAIWKFGLSPASARALLAEHGWDIIADVGAEDHAAAYPFSPADAAAMMTVERIALADKRA